MADVDKALTSVMNNQSPEEKAMDIENVEKMPSGPTDVTENEDGSVDVNFDPNANKPMPETDFNSNLAEILPDSILGPIGAELVGNYNDYVFSRMVGKNH